MNNELLLTLNKSFDSKLNRDVVSKREFQLSMKTHDEIKNNLSEPSFKIFPLYNKTNEKQFLNFSIEYWDVAILPPVY